MKQRYVFLVAIFALFISSNAFAQFYLKAGGTITNLASWGDNTDGTGTAPTDFSVSTVWVITNNSAVTLSTSWDLGASETVQLGDGASSTTLTVSGTGALPNYNNIPFTIMDLAALDIETASYTLNAGNIDPQTGSTIIYGSNAQDMISFSTKPYNVVVNDNIGLATAGIDINGTLTISAGIILTMNGLDLTVAALDCQGEIDGGTTNNSQIVIDGAGGTIKFAPGGQRLNKITVSLTNNTDVLTLASDLTIANGTSPSVSFTKGRLNLGGFNLAINCNVTFNATNFRLQGTSTSGLSLGGSSGATISGSLRMDTGFETLGSLTMNRSTKSLTLGTSLVVTNLVTVSAGTLASAGFLTLNADATQAAALAALCSTCAVTGNVTVENFLNASVWNGGWGLYGVNGVNGKTITDWESQVPMTCPGCNNLPSAAGNFTSIQGWDNTNCDYITNFTSATALTPGTGFWVYLATGLGTSADMNWSFTGTLAQGDVVKSIDYAGLCTVVSGGEGQNLVANPYASPISWTAFSADNPDVTSSVRYFTQGLNSIEYVAGFGGTGTGSNVIPAGQGFFVDNQTFGATTITFKESHKVPGNNTTLLWKGSKPVTSVNEHNAFRLHLDGPLDKDDALFGIKLNTSFECVKNEDVINLFETPGYGGAGANSYSKYTSISSQDPVSGKYMAINFFPPSDKRTVIPILVRVSVSGTYTLDVSDYDNYQSCMVIRDKVTNIYTDLKVSPYVFTISDTTSTPRFELIVCENGGGVVSVDDLFSSEHISICKDAEGPVVKTDFDKPTDAVITVYNLLGQQLSEVKVSGMQTTTHLNDSNLNHQVIVIKVTADNHSVSKKMLID